ncbi:hypothetical protein ACYSNR_03795 [Enterococcus sp. LJL128]|uniref:hypothetical protein n=1 Tax=Enterococcus sp. LJL51 TaxID=3416656 RepID=UPI003CF65D13
MKVLNIEYPTTLDKINDPTNDNIDVFVTLEDGFSYTVVVATIKNIEHMMENGYLEEGPPFIIVDELQEDTIRRAIEAHAKGNAYWLKLHYLSNSITDDLFVSMLEEIEKSNNSY